MLLTKSWTFAVPVPHAPFSSMPHGALSQANFDQYLKLSAPCSLRYTTLLSKNLLRLLGMWLLKSFWCAWVIHPVPFVSNMLFSQWITAHPTSSAYCSLFSRYGVRGFPAILLANETTMVRYRGTKDLKCLVQFYQETTGMIIIFVLWFWISFLSLSIMHTWG